MIPATEDETPFPSNESTRLGTTHLRLRLLPPTGPRLDNPNCPQIPPMRPLHLLHHQPTLLHNLSNVPIVIAPILLAMPPRTPIQYEVDPIVIPPSMLNQQQPPRPRIQHPAQMPQRIHGYRRGADSHSLYNGIIPLLRLIRKLQRGLLPKSDLGLRRQLRVQLLPLLPRDLKHGAGLVEEGYAFACSEIVIFCIPPCADGGFEDVARSLIYEAFAEGVDAAEGFGSVDLVVKGLREIVVAI